MPYNAGTDYAGSALATTTGRRAQTGSASATYAQLAAPDQPEGGSATATYAQVTPAPPAGGNVPRMMRTYRQRRI